MTEWESFLAQSRSDLEVFRLLASFDRAEVHECHPLHYLQMSTEKLAKAAYTKLGVEFSRGSHVAFSTIANRLKGMGLGLSLGWPNEKDFEFFLRKAAPIFREIDELCPAIGPQQPGGGSKEGPNVEYPWRPRPVAEPLDWSAPSQHAFSLFDRLSTGYGALVITFITRLQDRLVALEP